MKIIFTKQEKKRNKKDRTHGRWQSCACVEERWRWINLTVKRKKTKLNQAAVERSLEVFVLLLHVTVSFLFTFPTSPLC